MCCYHAVPVKVPQRPHLHLSQYTRKSNAMDLPPAPPATAPTNPPNNIGTSTYSLADFSFLQEEDDDDKEQERGQEWVDDSCENATETSTPQHPLLIPHDQLCCILQSVCSFRTQLDVKLLRDVTDALRVSGLSAQNESLMHRNNSNLRGIVMKNLQWRGYNAGICNSRWDKTNGYPAGEYEFIDVIVGAKSSDRVLVDIDFRSQFEIARPTPQYAALVALLPQLVVGSVEKVREMIGIMCDAARRSLKASGMHIPPWRKKRYVEAKWFGPHKRSTQIPPLQTVDSNACFFLQNKIRSGKGQISGLGRAFAHPLTSNNVY